MKSPALPWPHALLALIVVALWGSNFVVIKLALRDLPPLFLGAVRFFLAMFPAILFLRRPPVKWRMLAGYGLLIGGVQFGFLFIAMTRFISPALASLVVQTQVFFTIGLAMRLGGERVRPFQWAALALGALGLGVIVIHGGSDATPLGVALVLLAACGWAGGNQVGRSSGRVNMLAYVVWASAFSWPPLLCLSLIFEGWPAIAQGLHQAGTVTWAAVLWQAAGNTLFGYACWGWLLSRHPAATVAPMSLLVPVFGFAASAWYLDETLPVWKLAAAALVITGLALNLLWPKLAPRFSRENPRAPERG